MAEDIRIDSHKLLYHPCEVAKWLKGEMVYPIEIEVGLSGACNHRCIFCAVDYMGYQPNFLDKQILLRDLQALAGKGLKSVIYSGEGEPLLNKEAPEIFNRTKSYGIDIAMSSNGVLFTKEKAAACLKSFTWIRFSIAAATETVYHAIQQGQDGDLAKVYQNLADAVAIKHDQKLKVTLGAQLLLLQENKAEVAQLAKNLREIGLDYLTVKPYSQHPSSKVKREVDYSEAGELAREVEALATEDFAVYFRRQSLKNTEQDKTYDRCYALPFMTHIDAAGEVFPCVAFVGNENLRYGNIYEQSFVEIWESEHTRQVMQTFSGDFLKEKCRKACRLDEMNKYLNSLKHPSGHVNFI